MIKKRRKSEEQEILTLVLYPHILMRKRQGKRYKRTLKDRLPFFSLSLAFQIVILIIVIIGVFM